MSENYFGLGILLGVLGTLVIVTFYRSMRFKRGGKINWLDYLKIRDMLSHGQNYEAAIFALKKAYNISEAEVATITPERFHELMGNLRTEQAKGGK